MSYTYRTDKLLDAIGNDQGFVNQRNCPKQWVGFAIELETELQEATFEIERLKKSNLQLREGAEEQKQRIKRLEEALEGTVKWIVHLADSGDAGFWNPEEQSVIIAARAALKKENKL